MFFTKKKSKKKGEKVMNTQKNKSRRYKVLGTTLALALIFGGSYGIIRNNYPGIEQGVEDENDVSIKDHGVTLRLVNKTTNSYGEVDQTFTYSVSPANATNQAVTATAKYTDGTSCDSVMTVTVDTAAKTIKTSCKAAFNKKITITVTSAANSNAKGTVTLEYVKKLKSITAKSDKIQLGGDQIAGFVKKDKITWTDFYTPNYSVYTKDKTYNFTVSNVVVDVATYDDGGDFEDYGLASLVAPLIKSAIETQGTISDDQLWNLKNDNSYHSALKDGGCITYTVSFTITSDGKSANYLKQFAVGIGGRAFSGKTVNVDSITLETTTIEF